MSYKKILLLFIIIILVGVGINFFLKEKTVEAPITPESPLLGGDRDEHGCIGSAGYSWCEAKAECLRPWEEQWDDSCGVVGGDPVGVVPPLGGEPINPCTEEAKICSDGSAVGRSGPNCEFEKCPDEEI